MAEEKADGAQVVQGTPRLHPLNSDLGDKLVVASILRQKEAAWDLIRQGHCDLNRRGDLGTEAVSERGMTPLIISISENMEKVAIKLIKSGADINLADDGVDEEDLHGTPLIWACREHRPRVAEELINTKGINLDARDRAGRSALSHACQKKKGQMTEIALKLIRAGADLDSVDEEGKPALFHSAEGYLDEVAVELVRAGARVNIPGGFNGIQRKRANRSPAHHQEVDTAMWWAFQWRMPKLAIAIAKAAGRNCRNLDTYKGKSFVLSALDAGWKEVVVALVAYDTPLIVDNENLRLLTPQIVKIMLPFFQSPTLETFDTLKLAVAHMSVNPHFNNEHFAMLKTAAVLGARELSDQLTFEYTTRFLGLLMRTVGEQRGGKKIERTPGEKLISLPDKPATESNLTLCKHSPLLFAPSPAKAIINYTSNEKFVELASPYITEALTTTFGADLAGKAARFIAACLAPDPTLELFTRLGVSLSDLEFRDEMIQPGPAKLLARTKVKADEYFQEVKDSRAPPDYLGPKDNDYLGRPPPKLSARLDAFVKEASTLRKKNLSVRDFDFAVYDLVRVSITVPNTEVLMNALEEVQKMPGTRVIRVKNAFHYKHDAKPAQYRDVKVILAVDFKHFDSAFYFQQPLKDDKGVLREKAGWTPLADNGVFTLAAEIQLTLPEWTKVRKLNGLQYKVRRAKDINALIADLEKYRRPN